MRNNFNFKKFLIAIFIPLILLIISLGIMDSISYWDEFADVWLIWLIYFIIVFVFEWIILGNINPQMNQNEILSGDLKRKFLKYFKRILFVLLTLLILLFIFIPVGYFYNNQSIPCDQFELFGTEIRGDKENGIIKSYATRIRNNSNWDARDITIKLSILNSEQNIIDEKDIVFATWDHLKSGYTKRYLEESSYSGILKGLPKQITWKEEIISAKKVTFISDWF